MTPVLGAPRRAPALAQSMLLALLLVVSHTAITVAEPHTAAGVANFPTPSSTFNEGNDSNGFLNRTAKGIEPQEHAAETSECGGSAALKKDAVAIVWPRDTCYTLDHHHCQYHL